MHSRRRVRRNLIMFWLAVFGLPVLTYLAAGLAFTLYVSGIG